MKFEDRDPNEINTIKVLYNRIVLLLRTELKFENISRAQF